MKVLCDARATIVLRVSTPAVRSSIPDGRRPVTARMAMAPYDQVSEAPIAGQTPNVTNIV